MDNDNWDLILQVLFLVSHVNLASFSQSREYPGTGMRTWSYYCYRQVIERCTADWKWQSWGFELWTLYKLGRLEDALVQVEQQSLVQLVNILSNLPVLTYADFYLPFVLYADALEQGFSAVLYQHQGGKLSVITYWFWKLTTSKQQHHLHLGQAWVSGLKVVHMKKKNSSLITKITYMLVTGNLNAVGNWTVWLCWQWNFSQISFSQYVMIVKLLSWEGW